MMTYQTGAAFRRALEDRLLAQSSASGDYRQWDAITRPGLYIGGEREESITCSGVTDEHRLQSSWREGAGFVLAEESYDCL